MQTQPPNPQPNQTIPTPTTPKSIRRIRGDAFWSRLKSDHRQQIQNWLMEDRLPFRDVHQRVHNELHLDCALSTIGRCYKHILREQAVTELSDAHDAAQDILDSGANMAQMRAASMQLITKRLLEQALDNGDTSTLRDLGRLVLEAEEKEIRRERTQFLREKFQFKATEAALKLLPFAKEMDKEKMELEEKQTEQMMINLFGVKLLTSIVGGKRDWSHLRKSPPVNPACPTSAHNNPATEEKNKMPSPGKAEVPEAEKPLAAQAPSRAQQDMAGLASPNAPSDTVGRRSPSAPQETTEKVEPVIEQQKNGALGETRPTETARQPAPVQTPNPEPALEKPKREWQDQPSSKLDWSWEGKLLCGGNPT